MSLSILELLEHILEEISFLLNNYGGLSASDISGNPEKKRAAARSLEIIGEATKKLPNDFRNQHQEIEWRYMAGMRDILIHDYFDVDYDIVSDTIQTHIPELKTKIEALIKSIS